MSYHAHFLVYYLLLFFGGEFIIYFHTTIWILLLREK